MKLREAHIFFNIVDDENIMIEKGFMEAPMLEIDGQIFNYNQAIKILNK